jgi:gamma-glutamylcyclotransferase (GGCT)/AIG2-like uncharacterized protein YtfP
VTLYFAYGSNMDPKQMASRCPGSSAVGSARLAGYELAFVWDSPGWGGGVATVIPSSSREVWGVLWELTAEDEQMLDGYEGVANAVYTKERVDLDVAGKTVNALIYVATDARRKQPSARYLDALIRGARAFSLPGHYVEHLRNTRP